MTGFLDIFGLQVSHSSNFTFLILYYIFPSVFVISLPHISTLSEQDMSILHQLLCAYNCEGRLIFKIN